ncbi:MAG: primosomal protein N' [candidate division WOR-3 bacterium]|nr:primosomal protein N' [candidate division WOR-3 bacterium]
MFAEVSLLESSIDFLSYYVPQNLIPYLKIGSLVKVPLRGKIKPGIVVAVHDRMEVFNHKNTILKEIFQVVDEQFIPENLLNLLSWAREYYFASWGQIFQLVLSLPVYCYSVTPRNLNRQENFLSYGMSEKCKCDDEFQVILDTVNNRKHRVFLLLNNINIPLYKYYRELIINTLQLGRSVIFLVPEIRNIKEIISRLAVNENLISIWHSGLKTSDRRKIWFKIKSQKISLVIGTRSALFMPINDLGLIIIAEEHSRYYKEERAFHYHARELAIRYGEISQAAVLLESSTPSIESFYNTQIKKFKLITIAHKFINSVSNVRVINLQKHRDWIISEPLKEEILRANKQGGNVLLYHNKIGYARFVICGDCGYIHTCLRCGVPLALDLERDLFICRMCTNQTSTFDVCPSCHGYNFIYRGWGIQKIVSELKKILPNTPISVITSESSWKTLEPDKNIPQIFVVTKFGLWKLN